MAGWVLKEGSANKQCNTSTLLAYANKSRQPQGCYATELLAQPAV
jgi:hypothetical protein